METEDIQEYNSALLERYPVLPDAGYRDYKYSLNDFLENLLPQKDVDTSMPVAERLMTLIESYYDAATGKEKAVEANTKRFLIRMKTKFAVIPEPVMERWESLMLKVKDANLENAVTDTATYLEVIGKGIGIYVLLLVGFIFLLIVLNLIGFTVGSLFVALLAIGSLFYTYLEIYILKTDNPRIVPILYSILWTLIVGGLSYGTYRLLSYLYSADVITFPNLILPIFI